MERGEGDRASARAKCRSESHREKRRRGKERKTDLSSGLIKPDKRCRAVSLGEMAREGEMGGKKGERGEKTHSVARAALIVPNWL